MTFRQLLCTIARRWYVILLVMVCAGAFTVNQFRSSGLYSTRTVVYFIHQSSNIAAPWLSDGVGDESIVDFAGTIANEINSGRPSVRYATAEAPLYGVGVRQSVRVGLVDSGGQWWSSFSQAEIEVQIVGPTRAWVQGQQKEILDSIASRTRAAQGSAWDDTSTRITPVVVPVTNSIDHIAPSRLEQVLAIGAILGAAVLVGCWCAAFVDRRVSERDSRLAGRDRPEPGLGAADERL